MTVRELINLLLDCDMDRDVKLQFGDEIEKIEYIEWKREYRIVEKE